ncbi:MULTISPECIES: hypothetical protein [Thermomonosporaceae]|uniref:hypothetical protein n=1 Tax=Thermomonosporaceae TaxID=2012 RepID=UPI00255AF678|nr:MULTISPECIES: hypothetical protein [Thermomonosporaceae]MDL4773208.1 hypothetical protein [Actinomadura xylanilytica]
MRAKPIQRGTTCRPRDRFCPELAAALLRVAAVAGLALAGWLITTALTQSASTASASAPSPEAPGAGSKGSGAGGSAGGLLSHVGVVPDGVARPAKAASAGLGRVPEGVGAEAARRSGDADRLTRSVTRGLTGDRVRLPRLGETVPAVARTARPAVELLGGLPERTADTVSPLVPHSPHLLPAPDAGAASTAVPDGGDLSATVQADGPTVPSAQAGSARRAAGPVAGPSHGKGSHAAVRPPSKTKAERLPAGPREPRLPDGPANSDPAFLSGAHCGGCAVGVISGEEDRAAPASDVRAFYRTALRDRSTAASPVIVPD